MDVRLRVVTLGKMPEDRRAAWEEWLTDRPARVREFFAKYPLGTVFTDGARQLHLLGFDEADMAIVSEHDPVVDYDAAQRARQFVCVRHIEPMKR